jgi:molybdopterin molybdotransferase
MALVRLAGGIPRNLGIARDTPESLRAHLEQAAGSDLLVTTAGISVGEHDHLRRVIEAMGGRLDFWKLRMRPGAPVGFGFLSVRPSDRPTIPWIGLPGNPVSTMVTFELFVRPAIRRLLGHPLPFRAATEVELEEPVRLGPRLQHFLRAVASDRPAGRPSVRLTGSQGSGILTSMVKANALLIVPEGTQECGQGARMDALLLEDWRHQETPPF